MIVFPNCKINLGLHITAKRTDGYHDIETIFYPVPFTDLLEVIPRDSEPDCALEQTGLSVAGTPEQNLCVKAYRLLKKDFPSLPPITIYLHKQIPSGAGLGGGSADGAFMLQLLANRFSLPVTKNDVERYSLALGSDCPFFIENKPVLAIGRGEKMRTIAVDLTGWHLALLLPGLHVSTKEAFDNCMPRTPSIGLEEIIQKPISAWRNELTNQFEETVFLHYPELARYKRSLYEQGAVYASMSGTGSTIFGLFSTAPDAMRLREECGCETRILQL
jgi:4-diphosphocytidyl-2-C-methyl-D-erythritol kinase